MTTALGSARTGPDTVRTGPTLQRARELAGMATADAARAIGVTRRELRDIERGRRAVTVDLVDRALHAYGADDLALPPRQDLVSRDDPTLLVIGTDTVRVDPCRESDRDVLVEYVAAVRRQRGLGPDDSVRLRSHDLVQLAGVLDLSSDRLEGQLRDVMGAPSEEATRMARVLVLTGLCLAVSGTAWRGAGRSGAASADSSWLAREPRRPSPSAIGSACLETLAELVGERAGETEPTRHG